MDKPQPPPEAALIRRARLAKGLKMPQCVSILKARGIQLSVSRWSQIEVGYQTKHGVHQPVTGSDGNIAHMASVVGLSPARLAGAGRPQAAEILCEIQRENQEDPRLPDLVRQHWDDPDQVVRRLWEIDGMPEAAKLGHVSQFLAERDGGSGERSA